MQPKVLIRGCCARNDLPLNCTNSERVCRGCEKPINLNKG
jgi:hypothetical protein